MSGGFNNHRLAVKVTVIFLSGVLVGATLPWFTPKKGADGRESLRVEEVGPQIFAEVLEKIDQYAVFPPPPGGMDGMIATSLKTYLTKQDPYSDYLNPAEYVQFGKASRKIPGSIGLDVEKTRDGDVICYPTVGGPAALAGVKPGDLLLAIDGVSTQGRSLPAIVALALGKAGKSVVLDIAGSSGTHRQLNVTRSQRAIASITEYAFHDLRIIRIGNFTAATRQKLDYIVSRWPESRPIIIDFRSCGGGDFNSSVDSAMLFLGQNERIVSVVGRNKTSLYSSTMRRDRQRQQVFLWQDEFTASAAEVFIAALTENARATSIGKKTAGKGTRQDIIELQSGGALFITTGYLATPNGLRFDGEGLLPMYFLMGPNADTDSFYNQTVQLLKKADGRYEIESGDKTSGH
ncbi:S41 family peptidase [Nitrosospira sp. Is2]|uniref:S41 family peptidase n=1 Tax=Nitrosospira sp. Is2 TaxID=3080532 RepID=UPI002954EB20|nr:S41 family peptidase [Nitrosospira sp. Is2]WON73500.1 S41 family peptidase [Nitrosospira sp. Is2]